MLSLILAESSLELVPKELLRHPSVVSHSKKLGKSPSNILLDNSWHYAAMKDMKNEIKRGRPDLVHISLLGICATPLYSNNKIRIYVHTINDEVIFLGEKVNLPKSYHRFAGLIEKLFLEKNIENEKNLLKIKSMTFDELIKYISPKKIIALSSKGNANSYEDIAKILDENSCLVIGGFQKGYFSNKIKKHFDQIFRVDKKSLESHIVINRILYEYEKTVFM